MTSSVERTVTTPNGPIFQRLDQTAKRPYTTRVYAARMLWKYLGTPLFRCSLPRAFRFRRWILRRFGATLADHTYFYASVEVVHPWWLSAGTWCTFADGVVIYN